MIPLTVKEFDRTIMTDLNFIMYKSESEYNELFAKQGLFSFSQEKYLDKDRSEQYHIKNFKDTRVVTFDDENGNIIAWMKFQDSACLLNFVILTNSNHIKFGYILGTHSPLMGYSKGFYSANMENGYVIWVTNKI